ncbi:MAG: DUF975 family protein [Oscillospiraceae bacterium]|nr:DUF975 family protein [Oscillospiraceae bacterium]
MMNDVPGVQSPEIIPPTVSWTREGLKNLAKQSMKPNYWTLFVICLLTGIFGSSGGGSSSGVSFNYTTKTETVTPVSPERLNEMIMEWLPLIIVVSVIATALAIAYSFFVGNILYLGQINSAIESTKKTISFGCILDGFRINYLGRAWKLFVYQLIPSLPVLIPTLMMIGILVPYTLTADRDPLLISGLLLFVTLLLLVGMCFTVVLSYTFYFVPYLLAEHPGLSLKEALRLSKKMTDGEKLEIFALELSFFGWILLGCLICCGIGVLFVNPYIVSTNAWLYRTLKAKCPELQEQPEISEEPVITAEIL